MGFEETRPPFPQTVRAEGFAPRPFVRRTVMLVDDDPEILSVAGLFLRQIGHTVVEAIDAEEAQRVTMAHPSIDVVLTDYAMPGANGVELAKWFQCVSPRTRVAIISGTDEALSAGAEHGLPVLQKPVPLWVLARLIEQLGAAELQQVAVQQQ